MSDLVPTRSSDPELFALARQIKAAQQPEVDTMTTWLASWGAEQMMGHEQGAPPGGGMADGRDDDRRPAARARCARGRVLRPEVAGADGGAPRGRGRDGRASVIAAGSHAPTRALAVAIIEAQQTEIAQMKAMLAG